MKRFARPFWALYGVAALGACTSVPPSSPAAESWDSAGVRIVHNVSPRWTAASAWSVSEAPFLTIGVLNGPEEYQFIDISAGARQSNGRVVLVDGEAKTIRLYDGDGAFIRTLGEPGSGPGEFTDPGQVTITPGDTVVVWDRALFRITRFDPHGELADVQTVDLATIAKAVEPPLYPAFIEPLADGGMLVRLIEKAAKGFPSGSSRDSGGALRVSRDLSVVDTLMFFEDQEQVTVEAPWGPFSVAPPLGRRTWITHQGNPARICIGEQQGPEVACFDQDGSRTLVRWDSSPVPPTREEIDTWREEGVRLYSLKISPDVAREMLNRVPTPESRPAYDQILLDGSGNLWVELGPTAGASSSTVDFLVFDHAGSLMGTVPLPPVQVLEIGDDYVMGVFQDELEVQYLHLYRVRKPRTGEDQPV